MLAVVAAALVVGTVKLLAAAQEVLAVVVQAQM
jgi:hypothetical protein